MFLFSYRGKVFSLKEELHLLTHKMSKYTIVPPSLNLHFMITTILEFYTWHHYLETSYFYISQNF